MGNKIRNLRAKTRRPQTLKKVGHRVQGRKHEVKITKNNIFHVFND